MTTPNGAPTDDNLYLPDFCAFRMLPVMVLGGELLAFIMALARTRIRPYFDALIPGLWLLLVETAVYCAIQPSFTGGVIRIFGVCDDGVVWSRIAKAFSDVGKPRLRETGNRTGPDNIGQRLGAFFGSGGSLRVMNTPTEYAVTLRFPLVSFNDATGERP